MPPRFTLHPTGIYTADDLCAMLDVSPHTLSDARRSGELRATRKGRRIIFLGEWVLSWLRDTPDQPADEPEVCHA